MVIENGTVVPPYTAEDRAYVEKIEHGFMYPKPMVMMPGRVRANPTPGRSAAPAADATSPRTEATSRKAVE